MCYNRNYKSISVYVINDFIIVQFKRNMRHRMFNRICNALSACGPWVDLYAQTFCRKNRILWRAWLWRTTGSASSDRSCTGNVFCRCCTDIAAVRRIRFVRAAVGVFCSCNDDCNSCSDNSISTLRTENRKKKKKCIMLFSEVAQQRGKYDRNVTVLSTSVL